MNRPLLIIGVLIVVGLLAFGGSRHYQIGQQTRLDDIANLNKMKDALATRRSEIFNSEMVLRKTVHAMNLSYDLCFSNLPAKIATPSTVPNAPLPPPAPKAGAVPAPGVFDPCTGLVDYSGIYFDTEYEHYLNLVYDYNASALEINYKAASLGEPPIPLLEAYNPPVR
jgi:hypothetical protein